MDKMEQAKAALEVLKEYISTLDIVGFYVPVRLPDGLYAAELSAARMLSLARAGKLDLRRHDLFFRWTRKELITHISPLVRDCKRIKLNVTRYEDIPPHRESTARGFEKLVAQAVGGIHTGDDPHKADIWIPDKGFFECKGLGAEMHSIAQKAAGD